MESTTGSGQAARLVGATAKTLQRRDREGGSSRQRALPATVDLTPRASCARHWRKTMLLAHRIRIEASATQRDYFARGAGTARCVWNWALAEWQRQTALTKKGSLTLAHRSWTCGSCGADYDRDVNAAINLQRLATGALAAARALPVASQAVTPGTPAGMGLAGGGKVTPVRYEHGQQDGSGQEGTVHTFVHVFDSGAES